MMETALLTAAEWYLGIGGIIVGLGIINDAIKHRIIMRPLESAVVAVGWPVVLLIVYNMWKNGELE